VKFTFYLKELGSIGSNCFLIHINNAFKRGEKKTVCSFWKGIYRCKEVNCAQFEFKIDKLDESVDDLVQFECQVKGKISHQLPILPTNERFYGTKKAEIGIEILSNGIEDTLNSYINKNENQSVMNVDNRNKLRDVFKHIKYSFNQKAIGKNQLDDAIMSQAIYMDLDTMSKNLVGYIQNISSSPFGFLMMSEVQVSFLKNILFYNLIK
jgi:hypothetical protein